MSDAILIRLFARHFGDPVAALKRLDGHLASVGLPFDVKAHLREVEFPAQPGLPQGLPSFIYYFVPDSQRGSDQAVVPDPLHPSFIKACDGIGLNLGCPVRLLRALDAFARLAPGDQTEPKAALQNARQHLPTIEELLWLTVWKSPADPRRGGQWAGASGDVDWALSASGYPVFLEAKFRQSDWPRLSDAGSYERIGDGFLANAAHKFPVERRQAALHLVGATVFQEVTESILMATAHELAATPQIDALIFRSLSQVIDVVSPYQSVTEQITQLIAAPHVMDYPVHNVFFDIERRDARLSQRSAGTGPAGKGAVRAFSHRIAPSGRFSFPMPEPGAYRLNIPFRGQDGEPRFNMIPKYLFA
jgi:hypothetical protein